MSLAVSGEVATGNGWDKMAFEKRWAQVPVQSLIANGTADGQLQIADAYRLKVKQLLLLTSGSQPTLQIQVKRVMSPTLILVGKKDEDIDDRIDVSAYLVSDGAAIVNPDPNQARPKIGVEDFARAVYDEEPTVAIRTVMVDRGGRYIGTDPDSPFYVQLSDGSVNIGTVNAELEVQLSHRDDDPDVGDVNDSVRIGDGEDELAINPDGSINVNSASASNPNILNVEIDDANTEDSIAIPISTKGFRAKLRNLGGGPATLRVAYAAGETDTNYISIAPGAWYIPPTQLNLSAGITFYFQASKDNQVLEFESWT